jgi:hypothetical protein
VLQYWYGTSQVPVLQEDLCVLIIEARPLRFAHCALCVQLLKPRQSSMSIESGFQISTTKISNHLIHWVIKSSLCFSPFHIC